MRKSTSTALLLWLAVIISTACAGGAARSARPDPRASGPTTRLPLAVAAGDAELPAPRSPDASTRSFPSDELFLSLPPDSLIATLVESTSLANITSAIERLEAYGTRYVSTDSCAAAGLWIRERFIEYGYEDVRLDSFRTQTWQDSVWAFNVLAFKSGSERRSEHVILGGHYDSVTSENFDDPDAPAPGAEDNATGVAAVLEAARLLADIDTERNVVFACWSAEEEGLWGSRHFVAEAVADSMQIALYLNVDAIGYLAPPEPDGFMMADTSALAVAAWMCDVALDHTGYSFEPVVQPLGASDHNSFWEAGYNVVDSQVEPTSHYMHTPDDVIENTSPEFATAIAAVNIAAVAAAARVVGENPNLPPETTLAGNCAGTSDLVYRSPRFEWSSVDFDGGVSEHEYSLAPPGGKQVWTSVPGASGYVKFEMLEPGDYTFRVRSVDDDGATDRSPAAHTFAVTDTFVPTLRVDTNFLPRPLMFGRSGSRTVGKLTSARGGGDVPAGVVAQRVYENELLRFQVSCDASGYCGTADSVSVAIGDDEWSPWRESPFEFTLRPSVEDTTVVFRTRDDAGGCTTGAIRLEPVPAAMDLPLIHIDDWIGGDVPEATHDAFYDQLLAGHEHVEWEPLEHIEGGAPTVPSMEELGNYRTVLWTVGPGFEFLRSAQAESSYHYLEGYVRAGGNFILEGQSSLTSLVGTTPWHYDPSRPLPEFVVAHVGVDSMRNAGNGANPGNPNRYGWAFLGGRAIEGSPFSSVPVDTMGKWSDEYTLYGGIPSCEATRPTPGTRRILLFESFVNETLQDVPCATMRYPTDGTGAFAHLGFPFYYMKDAETSQMVDVLLQELADWQEPAELIFFDADATHSKVTLTWYLTPPDAPAGCHVERAGSESGAAYERLNDDLILKGEGGRFSYTDRSITPRESYSYRLRVLERWGGETLRGPWVVDVPDVPPTSTLLPPVPNPASRSVGVRYVVDQDCSWVDVAVYDCAGRKVRTLRQGAADAGLYSEVWDGRDTAGRVVAAGVYFVRARLGRRVFHRKLVLVR